MRTLLWLVLLAACRGPQREPAHGEPDAPPSSTPSASVAPSAIAAPSASAVPSTPTVACNGRELELESLLFAPTCTLDERDVPALQAAATITPKLDASVLPDRRVLVRLTNPSATPLTLVFGWHSAAVAFPVRARPKSGGAERPLVEASAAFLAATSALGQGWHYARAVLDPGGSVSVRLTIDEHVEILDYAGCPPNAKCAPNKAPGAPLAKGSYVLHVGVPLWSPRMGEPGVDVEWGVKL